MIVLKLVRSIFFSLATIEKASIISLLIKATYPFFHLNFAVNKESGFSPTFR
jgi:hypothetical protein